MGAGKSAALERAMPALVVAVASQKLQGCSRGPRSHREKDHGAAPGSKTVCRDEVASKSAGESAGSTVAQSGGARHGKDAYEQRVLQLNARSAWQLASHLS